METTPKTAAPNLTPEARDFIVDTPHARPVGDVLSALQSDIHGLSTQTAQQRAQLTGANCLPRPPHVGPLRIFLHQFLSPLIYILMAAALVSVLIGENLDALFIGIVLLLNAIIGTVQEYSAQKSAATLQTFSSQRTRVERAGEAYEIDAEELVPGDILFLESGDKVPADVRLLTTQALHVDESLLTGESYATKKVATTVLPADTVMAERLNMAYAGTFISRGRGQAVVTAIGGTTELGHLAAAIFAQRGSKPPLLLRMERFTLGIAVIVAIIVTILIVISLARGVAPTEIFLMAVALAVSSIPEGLPVALTVALAIGMERMAKRHVIVRNLLAVEALGSCTVIASDKTGTLTVNELTVRKVVLADNISWQFSGEGMVPEGQINLPPEFPGEVNQELLIKVCQASVLPNEGFLGLRDGGWTWHGDAVDVALLVMAHKAGYTRPELLNTLPLVHIMPFESETRFSASVHQAGKHFCVFTKGALPVLLNMCEKQFTHNGITDLDPAYWQQQSDQLAGEGYRVIALAAGEHHENQADTLKMLEPRKLTMIGLVAFTDPLRAESPHAVEACEEAGVQVNMVTGDDPLTAMVVARQLNLADTSDEIVSGHELHEEQYQNPANMDQLVAQHRIYARIEPTQKLDIVHSLQRQGHFVAVTGDGANDAPAMRAAQVSVSMGEKGTDVARDTSDLIITDDNFASIVAGIEEGRIAYANVRKVIFLLISTGAAEIVLFLLALFTNMPLPLFAVQLLWLNLITNGIQDIALAFERAEGDELKKPPRSPNEPIFNRLMVERVLISSITMGITAFALFKFLLAQGFDVTYARNAVLFLLVLFENIHVFNSRSETRSVFSHSPLSNPLLLFGTLAAQLIHVFAAYVPGLNTILQVQPITLKEWFILFTIAVSLLVIMELHKLWWKYRNPSVT